MSLISVIIPVYKVEKYLSTCVDSVLAQTYKDLEIILVDDGSPDNCPKICDEYAKKDSRIKVIHKQNGGLSDARNAGLDIATGEYVAFLDSDDVIEPEMYETLYNNLIKENADVASCAYYYTNENGYRVIKEIAKQEELNFAMNSKECMDYVYFGDKGWQMSTVTNKLYKAHIWKELRFEKGKIHEDEFAFHKIMSLVSKVVATNKELYAYRRNSSGIMANRNYKSYLDTVEAFTIRGIACADFDAKWHSINLKLAFDGYYQAKDILFCMHKKSLLKDATKQLVDYIKLLKVQGKISSKTSFRKLLELYFPELHRALFNFFSLTITPIKNKIRYFLREKKALKQKISQADVLLLNTVTHSNLGDQAIVIAEKIFFNKIKPNCEICELTGRDIDRHLKRLNGLVSTDKPVFIHGGGYIGSIWAHEEIKLRKMIKALSNHRLILLPQTVTFDMKTDNGRQFFEESKKVYSSHKNLTLFVREQMSFDFMKKNMPEVDCRLVPDIVLSYKPCIEEGKRKGVLLCLRSDIEKSLDGNDLNKILKSVNEKYSRNEIIFTDTVIEHGVAIEEREEAVGNKLRQFASAELIITDRLHGMVFALLSKTPCVALGNINGKVKAVNEWFADCPYVKYIDSVSELPTALAGLDKLKKSDIEYDFDINKFASLKEIIEKEVY